MKNHINIALYRKAAMTKILYLIYCWMLVAYIAVFPIDSARAKTPDSQQEAEQTYKFDGNEMKGYGVEVNAHIYQLDRMFGASSNLDARNLPQEEVQEKSWLGIAMKPHSRGAKQPVTGEDLSSIEVDRIVPDSAALAAGLREDDLIVGIDDQVLKGNDDEAQNYFQEAISRKNPGDRVKLHIFRGEGALELEATLKRYPRATSILKAQPDRKNAHTEERAGLLNSLLEKGGVTDDFALLRNEFRKEADKLVSPMLRKNQLQGYDYNPFRLQEVNYIIYNPLQLPEVARKITDRLSGDFNKDRHDLAALLGTAMDELDMTCIAVEPASRPPPDFASYMERLVKAIQHANEERTAVLSVLNNDDIDFLYATAPGLLKGNDDSTEKESAHTEKRAEEDRLLRYYQLILKLDISRLLNASAEIARALDIETLVALSKHPINLENFPHGWTVQKKENLTVIDTPAGRVLIGGTKDNTYTEDAALIIDLGGNDKYFNHAGGSTKRNPFSVVIDLSGNDVYSASDDFSQGAGLLGGGFLIDLEGDDRYMAKNFSQGVGVLGVGILADLAGKDQYTAVAVAQGAASFGVGILAEGGGDDTYFGNYFVQGAGDTKGFGAIVEAAGNDNYFAGGLYEDMRAPGKSYKSMSQGFGFGVRPEDSFVGASGGIGVIAEAEGNDTYVADYFAQGSSYWFSLGILDDRKGNDRYISGRYSQGAGIHSSAGILIDGEGDDVYLADFGVAQGCGHDFGIGFLLDNGGNDRYFSGALAQGVGNANGIGVLMDNGGDDEYILKGPGQGYGNFEPTRNLGSFGFLFDTGGGNDVYSLGGQNNSLSFKKQWGVRLDTN
jgi:hypothetical protein